MKKIILLFSILILMCSDSIFAQQKDEDKKSFKEEIGNILRQKLIDSLGLDEITADKFISLYNSNNDEIRDLSKEKRRVMELIELDPSAVDVGEKISRVVELEAGITEKRKAFLKDLETFLTPQQIAKTLVFRNNIGKEIKKEFRKHKKNNQKDNSDGGSK